MADKCRGCVVTAVRFEFFCARRVASAPHTKPDAQNAVCVCVFLCTSCLFLPGQDRLDRAIIPSSIANACSHISFDQIRRKVHLPVKVFPSSTSLAFLSSHNIEMWGLSCSQSMKHIVCLYCSACLFHFVIFVMMFEWSYESIIILSLVSFSRCEFCMLMQVLAECWFYFMEKKVGQ